MMRAAWAIVVAFFALVTGQAVAQSDELPLGAAKRLGTNLLRDPDFISASVALSPDGKSVAILGANGLGVYEVKTGKHLQTIDEKPRSLEPIAISDDGTTLAAVRSYGVGVWNLTTGKLIAKLDKAGGRSIAISADGSRVFVGGDNIRNYPLTVWDVAQSKELVRAAQKIDVFAKVAFAANGKRFAFNTSVEGPGLRARCEVWDVDSGKAIHSFDTPRSVSALAFSPDGTRLAVHDGRSVVDVWDVDAGRLETRFADQPAVSHCVEFSGDGKRLASLSYDGDVRIWNLADADSPTELYRQPCTRAVGLRFLTNGSLLAWGYEGLSLKIWDAIGGVVKNPFQGHYSPVTSMVFSVDGTRLTSIALDRVIEWDVATGRPVAGSQLPFPSTISRELLSLTSMSVLSPSGTIAAINQPSQTIYLFDVPNKKHLLTVNASARSGGAQISLSSAGQLMANVEPNGTASVWSLKSGRSVMTVASDKQTVHAAELSPDGQILLVIEKANEGGANDNPKLIGNRTAMGKARLLHVPGGEVVKDLGEFKLGYASAQSFSSDGSLLAIGHADGIRVVKVPSGEIVQDIAKLRLGGSGGGPVFSHDASLLAVPTFEPRVAGTQVRLNPTMSVTIVDIATGAVHRQFHNVGNQVRSIAFSPDRRWLATAGRDSSILLWDLRKQNP